jgi:hypothetical protein
MPKPNTFTPEDSETLSRLYETMTLREVAERMGRTYGSVLGQKHRLGLTKSFAQIVEQHPVTATNEQLAYTAGLIDGEGTVSIRKFRGKWKPHIRIANSSVPLMDWLSETFTTPSIFIERRRPKASGGLTHYLFHIAGLGYLPLYEALIPLLVIKREQMECLAEFSRLRLSQSRVEALTDRQLELVQRVRDLNIKPSVRYRAEQLKTFPSTT